MGLLGRWCATHPHSPGSGFWLYRGEVGPDVEGAPSWQVRGSESLWGPGRQRIAQNWERSNPSLVLGALESGVLAQMLAASWACRQLHW